MKAIIWNVADQGMTYEELDIPEQIGKEIYSGAVTSDSLPVSGLSRLAETKKQDYQD